MNLEEYLMAYKKAGKLQPKEEKIRQTICAAKKTFFLWERKLMLSYHEFLWVQFKLMRKRWCVLQFVLLCVLGMAMASAYEESYVQRGAGVIAAIFIILMIPELWKNRSCGCMEIEEASYYSLRQIYAARMVLFGIVDVLLLTAFCAVVTLRMHVVFMSLLVQFLLPMLVTACICFGALCSKYIVSEAAAVILCVLWSAAWFAITINEELYAMITLPVWLALAGAAFGFLGIAVFRTLNHCSDYWEVGLDEIRTL